MEKYLVSIEFRYSDAPKDGFNFTSYEEKVTIGAYDSFDDACINGNEMLETLEGKFDLHTFPDGRKAVKERFSKNGGAFGSKKDLITNLAYLKTPFQFFAKITTLKYNSIESTLKVVEESVQRYKEYKRQDNEN